MIVDSAVYRDGVRVGPDHPCSMRELCDAVKRPDEFVWVGLHEPTDNEMREVGRVFGMHWLAVEDAMQPHQRPKVELYGEVVFLVIKTLWYVDELDAVETGQVSIFVGPHYVVTVRHGAGGELRSTRRFLEEHTHVLGHGPSAVVYGVVDQIVDRYEEVLRQLEIDVDEVEASVFSPERTQDSQRIYVLKRELSEMRRAVMPLKLPMQRFANSQIAGISERAAPFFRDVADHVTRVMEGVEALDSLLSTAFDAHLTRVSVQQNEDMRKISAYAALAAVSTLIAGVYGMNFRHIPELAWRFGYAWAVGLMVVLSLLIWRAFKRSGWL
jgi:magnesium transporter